MITLNKPLSREQAEETVRAVETAVAAGAEWPWAGKRSVPAAMREAATALGISHSSISHRLIVAHERFGLAPNGIPPTAKGRGKGPARPALPEPKHERDLIRLRDEVADLKKRLEVAHRESMDQAGLAEVIAGLIADVPPSPSWVLDAAPLGDRLPNVPVAPIADWHAGETVEAGAIHGANEYTIAILEQRVRRWVDKVIRLTRDHGPGNYPGIVVPLLGDLVSGGLHAELKKTDELRILPSILKVRDLLIEALTLLADHFGKVFVPCVGGNHGRLTMKPEFKKYNEENADWMIYQLLARAFRERGERRIIIQIPPSNEAEYSIFSLRVLQVHGDMLGVKGGDGIIGSIGPIMRGKMKLGARMRSIGQDFDLLLMGHWHQELFLPGVIVSNTLKGWDEYAMRALSAPHSLPSQPLFYVHPVQGITSYSTIKLEEPALRDPRAGWVSFPAVEAT